jgi:hypothetical protein
MAALMVLCAASVRADGPRLGTNLSGVVDWQTQFAFVDVFKTARAWIPQHEPFDGTWDTGEPIDTDADGWVASLAPGQAAANVFVTSQGGNYPAGDYICLYDGEGTIEFRQDGQIISQTPGRIVVRITPSPEGLTWMRLTATNPADPVRNIRIIMPGFESTYDTQVFHPMFLDSLSPYEVIRFMDWQRTNETELADWADRPTPATYSQATGYGVALEHMIDLCNRLEQDAWFCMPHRATDDFITQFAAFVRDHLDPELRIYIEHSNEVWNGIFPQHHYAEQQGLARGLSDDPWEASMRYHAERSVEIFALWDAAFGPTDRLTRVLGGWHGNPYTNGVILDWNDAHEHGDALGTAPYFGGSLGLTVPQLEGMTVEELLDHVEVQLNDPSGIAQTMAENTTLATDRGLEHITYEGGQHIVDFANSDNDTLTALFIGANRHPRMKDLYDTYLPMWVAQSGGGLFVHFTHIGAYSRYGSWGALETQTQEPATAPKWQALLEFAGTAVPGDLDGDGDVDLADLGILLASFLTDDGGDLDGDGDTDLADLGILLANFGSGLL